MIDKILEIIITLPIINRIVTNYLFQFLSKVCANGDVNKMHANNLAIVFAPSLLKPKSEASLITTSANATRVVETMISNYSSIFKVSLLNLRDSQVFFIHFFITE